MDVARAVRFIRKDADIYGINPENIAVMGYSAGLPPTFYCYGTEDPFYRQFEAQVALMEEVGIATDTIVLDEWPHGFGGDGGWVADYAAWLERSCVYDNGTSHEDHQSGGIENCNGN